MRCPAAISAIGLLGAPSLVAQYAAPHGRLNGSGQATHLILADRQSKQIESATVAARGLSVRGKIMNAESGPDSFDWTRTLQVHFNEQAGDETSADVWLPGMTAVQTLQIDSITYTDRAVWKMETANSCRISPEKFMRIAQQ